jgi:hypothetical protein
MSRSPLELSLVLDRRSFLGVVAAAVGGSFLELGCSDEPGGGPPGDATAIFEAYEQMRAALRTSPDHLVAEAERAVASRDPARILRFVADSIATIPPGKRGFDDAARVIRWGTRVTLRCGAGTMREKAELLAELTTRAGFPSEVVAGSPSGDLEAFGRATVVRAITREFRPTVDEATMTRWREAVGIPRGQAAARIVPVDENGAAAAALGASILPTLPASLTPVQFNWSSLGAVPLVKLVVAGKDCYANPNLPSPELDRPYVTSPSPAGPTSELPRVTVRLSVTTSTAPRTPRTVVEGSFSTGDLLGRQLAVQLVPAEPAESALLRPLAEIQSLIPTLALHAVDLPAAERQRLSVAGSLLTVRGDLVESDAGGVLRVNGEPLVTGGDASALAASVATLRVEEIVASGFPTIKLRVQPLDAGGQAIVGLPASALRLEEQGARVSFLAVKNSAPPPKVLFILDTSESIPAAFRQNQAAAVVRQVAERLLTIDAGCQFAASAVMAGITAPTPWTGSPTELESSCQTLSGSGSDLWAALAKANQHGASILVLISDGQEDAQPTALQLTQVGAGAPVVILGVGEVRAATMTRIATLSGGRSYTVAQPQEAVDSMASFLQGRRLTPIVLSYQAKTEGPATRQVTVSLPSVNRQASGSYQVPGEAERVAPVSLTGIFLTVGHGGQEITRTLVGRLGPADGSPLPAEVLEEVRYGLCGVHLLSLEGGAPTLAHWLDDLLTARLTIRPFWEAWQRHDGAGMLAAYQGGMLHVPAALMPLHHVLPQTGDAVCFETGLRAALLSSFATPARKRVQRADLLPFTRFSSLGGTDRANFETTLRRSAVLSVAEGASYPTSTYARLRAKSLRAIAPFASIAAELPSLSPAQQAAWIRLLEPYQANINVLPSDGALEGFWTVDPETGSVLGILPDGTGGGIFSGDRTGGDWAAGTLNLGAIAGDMIGLGLGFGIWVCFAKTMVQLILAAAAAIEKMEGGPPFSANKPLCDLACDIGKNLGLAALGLGAVSNLDNFVEAITGSGIPCGC